MSETKRIIVVPQDLKSAIEKALINGKWLITVSYKNPGNKDDLKCWWKTEDYPALELGNVLEHLKQEIAAKQGGDQKKENGNAEVKW